MRAAVMVCVDHRGDDVGPCCAQVWDHNRARLGRATEMRFASARGFALRGELFGPLVPPVQTAQRSGGVVAAVTFARPTGEIQSAVALVPVPVCPHGEKAAVEIALAFCEVPVLADRVAARKDLVNLVFAGAGSIRHLGPTAGQWGRSSRPTTDVRG
jgi:hypothetical protein